MRWSSRCHRQPEKRSMFNYRFPVFCFGLGVTGIVFLGILEASAQLKDELAETARIRTPDHEWDLTSSHHTQPPLSTVPTSHD